MGVGIHRNREDPGQAPTTWTGGYSKKGEESNGAVSMINLLVRDLDKEMTEASTEEKEAQKVYEAMMNDAAKKRANDVRDMGVKESAKAGAQSSKIADEKSKKDDEKEL